MNKFFLFLFFIFYQGFSQNISLNKNFIENLLRYQQLNEGKFKNQSFTIRPLKFSSFEESLFTQNLYYDLFSNTKKSIQLKLLPIEYIVEYNSHHPYNRNNGSMIPNKGYQHIFSAGFFGKLGPLEFQFNPEHHYSENKPYEGFWEGHYDYIWKERYELWNFIDIPERFGEKSHNRKLLGQTSISLNYKNISIGISNENLWWGPSKRNSIMMSNHAEGFRHISFKTNKPIQTFVGNFEWQIITARLEASGYTPPNPQKEFEGQKLYVPKINQNGRIDDWRYYQAGVFTYSPKWISGLNIGFIKWVQMYRGLIEGDYWWMPGRPNYFPLFGNLFRKNDSNVEHEEQTDQAAGLFFRWLWIDSKFEIYGEFHRNDAIYNVRDFLVDSDHSRATTFGFSKILNSNDSDYIFSWEWTQLEASAGNLIRRGGSWYEHSRVFHGYTNKGEVIGAGIGPGSNSHYFSIEKIKGFKKIGFAFEIIDNDNDFYHRAFISAQDYRRYWKDFNFHFNYTNKLKNFWISSDIMYSRSLNYQWQLDDNITPYYHPGKDVNNFHATIKLTYLLPFSK